MSKLKEQGWLEKEVETIEKLKSLGLPEELAIDCMVSRTTDETQSIIRFLERYGDKILK